MIDFISNRNGIYFDENNITSYKNFILSEISLKKDILIITVFKISHDYIAQMKYYSVLKYPSLNHALNISDSHPQRTPFHMVHLQCYTHQPDDTTPLINHNDTCPSHIGTPLISSIKPIYDGHLSAATSAAHPRWDIQAE